MVSVPGSAWAGSLRLPLQTSHLPLSTWSLSSLLGLVGSSICFLPPGCWVVSANGKPQWEIIGGGTMRSLSPKVSTCKVTLDWLFSSDWRPLTSQGSLLSIILSPLDSLPFFPLVLFSPRGDVKSTTTCTGSQRCSLWPPRMSHTFVKRPSMNRVCHLFPVGILTDIMLYME